MGSAIFCLLEIKNYIDLLFILVFYIVFKVVIIRVQ